MSFPIRLKYTIEFNDTTNLEKAKKLVDLGIINLKERKYKVCSCGSKVYDSFPKNQLILCSCCGKRIRKENFKETDFILDKINYNKIFKLINEKLKPLNFEFIKEKRIFKHKKNCSTVIIPEISSHNFILSRNGGKDCLFIILDGEKTNQRLLVQWTNRSWNLIDFLEKDNSVIRNVVNALGRKIKSSQKLEEQFSLLTTKSPTFFEQKFIPYFIEELKKKNDELNSYLLSLKLNNRDLTNSKVIMLGGAGSPDFFILNLYRYLSDGLKPDKYGEAKRYNKTKFTISDYGKAVVHSNEGENLMIISTDDIQKEVWVKIIESMRTNGYFKNVLIDRDLILLLLNILKIDIKKI